MRLRGWKALTLGLALSAGAAGAPPSDPVDGFVILGDSEDILLPAGVEAGSVASGPAEADTLPDPAPASEPAAPAATPAAAAESSPSAGPVSDDTTTRTYRMIRSPDEIALIAVWSPAPEPAASAGTGLGLRPTPEVRGNPGSSLADTLQTPQRWTAPAAPCCLPSRSSYPRR